MLNVLPAVHIVSPRAEPNYLLTEKATRIVVDPPISRKFPTSIDISGRNQEEPGRAKLEARGTKERTLKRVTRANEDEASGAGTLLNN
ncbi:hypothetical protein WN51_02504 [Melipona quadrifasciata]|uniref:Uncharacterized protein n=1 Tax=Melipona quadrifasciata TaxID=166423 RepID=A0A0N0BDN8_9HYME|nr:hypothetical protein WN51_02504 [Melipona quadrifasciata]